MLDRVIAAGIIVVILAAMVGIGVGAAELLYDDWRCAFAECRITK